MNEADKQEALALLEMMKLAEKDIEAGRCYTPEEAINLLRSRLKDKESCRSHFLQSR